MGKLTRRAMMGGSVILGAGVILGGGFPAWGAEGELKINDDGLYHQEWFLESFLDLREDLAEAASQGKHFVVLWEQRGCPYCRELHRVNFAKKQITDYVKTNFVVLQLNLWGSREVTDFDGKTLTEKALARRWRVSFTPTVNFFPKDPEAVAGKSGREAEVFRLPGYFKPFHFLSAFQYVRESRYESQPFQRFIQERAEKLRAAGKPIKVW